MSAKTIDLICDGCGITFTRLLREHTKRMNKGVKKVLCKNGCHPPAKMNSCVRCGTPTINPKFCSSSCAATINGKLYPKRKGKKITKVCTVCGDNFPFSSSYRRTKCPICFENSKIHKTHAESRLGQFVKTQGTSKGFHPAWAFSRVRSLNRQWNSKMLKLPCARCGYSIHVELAHIRPITSFKMSDTIGEINSPSNVVPLADVIT